MNARNSLIFYSAWSACVAVLIIGFGTVHLIAHARAAHEWIYFLVVALFHGIFAIWCAKGKTLPAFQRATVIGRLATAALAALVLLTQPLAPSPSLTFALTYYAMATMMVDIGSAIWTWRASSSSTAATTESLSFESKNRIAFALYMIVIGSWQVIAPNSLLALLRMPATDFAGVSELSFGPIHILGVQILVLAAYNLVAAKQGLKPLIDAGMHGGVMTTIAFIALVATGLIHPINLILPAVDAVSVTATVIHRMRQRRMRQLPAT